jgi:subfamily B ATP-binding cassette protein MsbA
LRPYLRLLRFAAPYKLTLAAAILCMAVLSLSTAAYVYMLGPTLEFLFRGDPHALAGVGRFLPASWDLAGKLARLDRSAVLAVLPAIIVGLAAVKGVAYFGQFYLMGMVGQRMVADVRRALFDHLLRLSPTFYATRHSGDILQRFSADVLSVETAVSNAIPSYLRDGLTVVVMLVSCFVLDWRMSLVAFGAVPLTLLPVVRLAKRLKRVTGHAQSTAGELSEMVQEAVSGMRVVQAYGMQRWESERFSEANRKLIRILRRSYLVRAFSSPLMEIMGAAGLAAAIWWVGGRILAGELEPGKFFSFVAAVLLLYTPVKQLGRVGQIAMQGAAAGDRIFEILDTPSAVPDDGRDLLAPFSEAIRYERVTFAYGDRPVLHGLDLEIRKGEVVALVGASGGGKTTVANLLPRFWDVVSGRITIDGKDVREVTLESLRAQLAIVTQETVLFNDTIRANIAYGRPEVSLAEIERAARLAQAHGFIQALPHGYETRVGEKGVLLSGGQRQRIAIARAFLKDAPILVLDEATSALDAESEREVQRALDSLMSLGGARRRTTLVIAHRLSTVRNADTILVLDGGRIVQSGTHAQLLAQGGLYADLYRTQFIEDATVA